MKRNRFFIVCMMLLCIVWGVDRAEASSFREVKQVSNSSLTVKQSASASSATVGSLPRGEFVTVFATTNGWARVEGKTLTGFVDAKGLITPKSTIKIASSKSGLVVKRMPTMNTATLATLSYNMIVEDFGSVGSGWSFVQYGNVTGYVVSSYINTPKTTTKVAQNTTILRNIASQSGANLGAIAKGTQVTVHSTLVGWSYVSSGDKRGYVVAKDLAAVQQTPAAKPQSKQKATPQPSQKTYKKCDDMRKDFPQGVPSTHWAYNKNLDRDGDQWACELQ